MWRLQGHNPGPSNWEGVDLEPGWSLAHVLICEIVLLSQGLNALMCSVACGVRFDLVGYGFLYPGHHTFSLSVYSQLGAVCLALGT